MLVNDGGRVLIYERRYDPILLRHYFSSIKPGDFKLLYANRLVRAGTDKKGNPKFENAAEVWLHHPKRRQYLKGFVFHPKTVSRDPETYNLWQGFAVEEKPGGSWDLMKQHLLHTVCGSVGAHYDYFLDWMASLLQHPERKGHVCIVLIGEEGAGKSIVGDVLYRILGQHAFVAGHPKHLVGNFNLHLRDLVFLLGNEAFYAGDKAHKSVLNALITDPVLPIEGKFRDIINTPNLLHIILTANPGWVIPASLGARRFCVFTVSDEHVGDFPYFKAIFAELENDGYEAMLHELRHRDISGFDARAYPDTKGLQQQKKLSLPIPLAWWMEVLQRGYVWRSKHGLEAYFGQWHPVVSTELLYESFREFAAARGDRHPMPRELLARDFLCKAFGAKEARPRDGVTGEHMVDDNTGLHPRRKAEAITKLRPPSYRLGTLSAARKAFKAHTKLDVSWSGR